MVPFLINENLLQNFWTFLQCLLFATAEGEDLTENVFLDYKNFFHKQYFKSYYSFLHSGYHVKYFTTRKIIIQVTIIPPNTIHLSC